MLRTNIKIETDCHGATAPRNDKGLDIENFVCHCEPTKVGETIRILNFQLSIFHFQFTSRILSKPLAKNLLTILLNNYKINIYITYINLGRF